MAYSPEWDQRYAENTHLSIWPWSDLVSLVHRYGRHIIEARGRVLELGCGAGANIPFFTSIGMRYYSVEGSQVIVDQLHQRYPDLVGHISVGDFTKSQPYGREFDLIVDRASITHNNTASIMSALRVVDDALKAGGVFIGSGWFSINHSDFHAGVAVDDAYTKNEYCAGPFAHVGKVHFSNEAHLRELFSHFELLYLEEKITRQYEPRQDYQIATWNIVVRKSHG